MITEYCNTHQGVYDGLVNDLKCLFEDISEDRKKGVGILARHVADATAKIMAESHCLTIVRRILPGVSDYFRACCPDADKRVIGLMTQCFAGMKAMPRAGTKLNEDQRKMIAETRTLFDELLIGASVRGTRRASSGTGSSGDATLAPPEECKVPEFLEWESSDEDCEDDDSTRGTYELTTSGRIENNLDGCTKFLHRLLVKIDEYNCGKPREDWIGGWTLSCGTKFTGASAKLTQKACEAIWADLLRVLRKKTAVPARVVVNWPTTAAALFENCKNVKGRDGTICGLHTSVATVSPLFMKKSGDLPAADPPPAATEQHADPPSWLTVSQSGTVPPQANLSHYADALSRACHPSILYSKDQRDVLVKIGAKPLKPDPKLVADLKDRTAIMAGIDMGNCYLLQVTAPVWTRDNSPGKGGYAMKEFHLHVGEWYEETKINKLSRAAEGLSRQLRPQLEDLAQHPAGTADLETFHAHVQTVAGHASRLMKAYGSQKMKKLEFSVHGGKQRVISEFMGKVVKAVKDGERMRRETLPERENAGAGEPSGGDKVAASKEPCTLPRNLRDETVDKRFHHRAWRPPPPQYHSMTVDLFTDLLGPYPLQMWSSAVASRRSRRRAVAGGPRRSFGWLNSSSNATRSSGYRNTGPPSTTADAIKP